MSRAAIFKTVWGWMGIAASSNGVKAIILPQPSRGAAVDAMQQQLGPLSNHLLPLAPRLSPGPDKVLQEARAQVIEYLSGKRRELHIPVDLSEGTPFQRRVWRVALRIPYGRVRSYQWVATKLGGKRYARAVGTALGANPVPLIVPCHRVLAHDGSLGGFSGGLHIKRQLLKLEGTLVQLKS